MNHNDLNQFQVIAKLYWQPVVIIVLGILLTLQVYSWGSSYVELSKVDHLITQAADTNSSGNDDKQGEQNNPSNSGNQTTPRSPARNIFKDMPVNFQLTGIYLDKAIINGNPVAAGDKIGKATVTEIGVDYVMIDVEGKDQPLVLQLFQGSGGNEGGGRSRSQRGGGPGSSVSPSTRGSQTVSQPSLPMMRAESAGGRSGGPPPEAVARFRSMSPQQREEMRARFENMSPEQRREAFRNLRGQ